MRAVTTTSAPALETDTLASQHRAPSVPGAPVIVAAHLTKTYTVADKDPAFAGTIRHFFRRRERAIHAVRDATFSVAEGEIVGFLGPNGAGKTTTLKMLTGLLHPTSGTVSVLGHTPFARDHAFLRAITLVMGNKQQLMWDLPAADSLRIQAAVYGVPDDERDRRTRSLAEMLDVADKLTQPVRKLSLGERMKVEILAALLHRPRVLFLDEPTLGLDVNAQAAVRSFLREYNQREHATILLTSHDMTDISALCRRVLVIDDGTLVFDGSLEQLVREKNGEREIVIDFATSPSTITLPDGARLVERDGLRVRIAVHPDATTRAVTELLRTHDVKDLAVHDPPIEDVVRRMFKKGHAPDPSLATTSSSSSEDHA
jgi:ABC-2 type transport system ATP-binding protein